MKRVVVTGGAKGIGKAIVKELASGDYEIIATFYHSAASAKELDTSFANVQYRQVNLRDRNENNDFLNKLNKEAPIDVLINNAGIWLGKPFENMTEDELYEQAELNFTAPARVIHGLLPSLKKAKAPIIINISSQAVNPIFPGEAMYSAAKSGLSTLSQVLRAELNPLGIRVITVEPWGVNTYGIDEPSGMVLPAELAQTIRYVIEAPPHLQLDKVGISHIKQGRGDYPEWIEK